jgi:hypothetical protein
MIITTVTTIEDNTIGAVIGYQSRYLKKAKKKTQNIQES